MTKQLPYGLIAEITSDSMPKITRQHWREMAPLRKELERAAREPDSDIIHRWMYGRELLRARAAGNALSDEEQQDIVRRCYVIEASRVYKHGSKLRTSCSGFVYVIEFHSGVIKVGKALDADRRVRQHAKVAAAHGDSVARHWISKKLNDYTGAETTLIRYCKKYGVPAGRAEFFREISWEDVVSFARAETHSP